MRRFLLCIFCVVAVSAVPDDQIKLMDADSVDAETVPTSTTPSPSEPTPMKEGPVADRTRLLDDLFTGYNKLVHPDNLTLKIGVALINFNVVENRNALDSYVFLRYYWPDARLAWDPSEYGGTNVIRLEAGEVWKPDVTLYNSADPVNMVNCWASNVLIFSSGNILWVPPCKMQSLCTFSLRKEPFGEQTCTFKFGSWTYDGNTMDLQFYKGIAAMDLSYIQNNSGFEVLSTTATRNVRYYSGFPEPYLDMTFNMTIKRIPAEVRFAKM